MSMIVRSMLVFAFISIAGVACSQLQSHDYISPADANSEVIIYSLAQGYELSDSYYSHLNIEELDRLDRYYIVDEMKIKKNAANQALDLVRDFVGSPDEKHMCFNPRHAIQYQSAGEQVLLLICFQCQKIYKVIKGDVDVIMMVGAERDKLDSLFMDSGLLLPIRP